VTGTALRLDAETVRGGMTAAATATGGPRMFLPGRSCFDREWEEELKRLEREALTDVNAENADLSPI